MANQWICGICLFLLLSTMAYGQESSVGEDAVASLEEALGEIETNEEKGDCHTIREYITTLEFLRDQKKLGVEERQARKIAFQVAKGCTGAAQRFINSFNVLMTVDAGVINALRLSLDLSRLSHKHTTTFLAVFRRAYLKQHLDLDLNTSIQLAKMVSIDYKGKIENALLDFEKVLTICRDDKLMGLSLAQCGQLAADITKVGEDYPLGVAETFRDAYEYLRLKKELNLTIAQALHIAKDLVSFSAVAVDNFKTAFEYGIAQKGLSLTLMGSLKFAHRMAEGTGTFKERLQAHRLPASSDQEGESEEPE